LLLKSISQGTVRY